MGNQSSTPILAYSRYTGEPLAIVPSSSEPDRVYIVTMGGTCSCPGFTYRAKCKHVGAPAPQRPAGTPLVGRLSA